MTIPSNDFDHLCYCIRHKVTKQYYYYNNSRRCWLGVDEIMNLCLYSEQTAHANRNKLATAKGITFAQLEVVPVRLYVERQMKIESVIK